LPGGVVTRPLTEVLPVRLPKHLSALQRLCQRGVALEAGAGESVDEHAARLETELMRAFQENGSSADFEALYDQARGPLLLWIGSLASGRRCGIEPAELLQDTFVNVYRYARSFRASGPRSFRVWSRTIAGNLVRRSRFERRRSFQDMPEGLQEPTDRQPTPATALLDAEDRRLLERAWILLLSRYAAAYEQLSPRDQRALVLVEVENASYQDACVTLGVGLSNLKMILFRARRRIRAAISADFLELPVTARPAPRRAS